VRKDYAGTPYLPSDRFLHSVGLLAKAAGDTAEAAGRLPTTSAVPKLAPTIQDVSSLAGEGFRGAAQALIDRRFDVARECIYRVYGVGAVLRPGGVFPPVPLLFGNMHRLPPFESVDHPTIPKILGTRGVDMAFHLWTAGGFSAHEALDYLADGACEEDPEGGEGVAEAAAPPKAEETRT